MMRQVLVTKVGIADLMSQLLMHLEMKVESDSLSENHLHHENLHKIVIFFLFCIVIWTSQNIQLSFIRLYFSDLNSKILRCYGISHWHH